MKTINSFSSVLDKVFIASRDTISDQEIVTDKTDENDSSMQVIVIDDQEEETVPRKANLECLMDSDRRCPDEIDLTEDTISCRPEQRSNMRIDSYSDDVIEIEDEEDCSVNGIHREAVQTLERNSNFTAIMEEAKFQEDLTQYSDQSKDESSTSETPTMNSWICLYCDETFNNYGTFDDHLRIEHMQINEKDTLTSKSESKLNCNLCNENFDDKDFLKHRLMHSRMRNSQPIELFCCAECNEIFSSGDELKNHYEKNHSTEKLQETNNETECSYCGVLFESNELFIEHIKTHFNCEQITHQSSKVYESQNISSKNSFECPICFKKYAHSRSLTHHMKRHCASNDIIHRCQTCLKYFNSQEALEVHNKTECCQKLFTCPMCLRKFNAQNKLEEHTRFHSVQFAYAWTCSHCPSKFETQKGLNSHQRIHCYKSPIYTCGECSRSFISATKYEAHLRGHIKDTDVTCTLCSEVFKNRYELTAHSYTHIIHHVCDICTSAFVSLETLNKHQKTCKKTPEEIQVSASTS